MTGSCVGRLLLVSIAFLVSSFFAPTSSAANIFWDGTNNNNLTNGWNAAASWSTASNATTPNPAAPPGAADVANFNISTVTTAQIVDLNAAQSALGLVFASTSTGGVLIQSGTGTNTLTLGTSGITVSSGSGADTISPAVALGGPQTWTNNSTNVLTVSGNISNGSNLLTIGGTGNTTLSGVLGNGSGGLTKTGTGTLTLSNFSNSYTGPTIISQGTLLAADDDVIPFNSALTVNGTFNTGGFLANAGSLTGSGTVTSTGTGSSEDIEIGFDNTSPPAFTGVISDAAGGKKLNVIKNGTGKLTLGGTSTFSGFLDVLEAGTLELNTSGVLTAPGIITVFGSGTLTLDGGGSSVTQSSGFFVIVGSNTAPQTGTINIGTTANGAVFTTGSNGANIKKTGTINIGSGAITGTLNASGFVTVDGVLARNNAGSNFNLATGTTMTIENGGRASFTGTYNTASNAIYNIVGVGSKLETLSAGTIGIAAGAQVNVTAGGLLSSVDHIDIGNGGNGTLTADGSGSTVTALGAGQNSNFGFGGSTATAMFSNNATANFSTLQLVTATTAGTTANMNIQSGADLSATILLVNIQGGSTAGTLTVTDPGSTVTLNNPLNPAFQIGATSGTATLNVNDNAVFTVAGNSSTTMNASAVININGGSVALNTLTYNGGTVNLNSGSLSYGGNLTVGLGGMLGQNLTLDATRSLTLSGITTIDAFHTLTLSGGTLNTGALVVNGTLAFNGGTLGIIGAGGLTIGSGGPLSSAFTLNSGRTLNVTNATTVSAGSLMVLESGATFSTGSLANSGEFDLDGLAATANATTVSNSGLIRGEGRIAASAGSNAFTNAAGGELRAESGKRIQVLGTNGANAGKINLQGGTAEFSQPLTNGGAGEIVGRGTLITGGSGLTNNGNIALSGGLTDVFGDVNNATGLSTKGITISGNAGVTFWDDVTNGAGSLFKVSAGSSATFFGAYGGAGTTGAGQVNFESDITPGFSPASISFGGNVALSSTANLKIELGGTALGTQFDQVHVTGELALDGALRISLINGFTPAAGNSFEIITAAGGINGAFASAALPALSGLMWQLDHQPNAVSLVVAVAGDYNHNGVVDAADFVVWRKMQGQTGVALAADGNGNGTIDSGDFDIWRAHFGQTAGSGSALPSAESLSAAVPEPSSALLLFVFGASIAIQRGRGVASRIPSTR
jgi:autotransporter-associated beta strand protein